MDKQKGNTSKFDKKKHYKGHPYYNRGRGKGRGRGRGRGRGDYGRGRGDYGRGRGFNNRDDNFYKKPPSDKLPSLPVNNNNNSSNSRKIYSLPSNNLKNNKPKTKKKSKESKEKKSKSKEKELKSKEKELKSKEKKSKSKEKELKTKKNKKDFVPAKKLQKRLKQISDVYKKMNEQIGYDKYKKKLFSRNFYNNLKKTTSVDINNFTKVKKSAIKNK